MTSVEERRQLKLSGILLTLGVFCILSWYLLLDLSRMLAGLVMYLLIIVFM